MPYHNWYTQNDDHPENNDHSEVECEEVEGRLLLTVSCNDHEVVYAVEGQCPNEEELAAVECEFPLCPDDVQWPCQDLNLKPLCVVTPKGDKPLDDVLTRFAAKFDKVEPEDEDDEEDEEDGPLGGDYVVTLVYRDVPRAAVEHVKDDVSYNGDYTPDESSLDVLSEEVDPKYNY